MKYLVLALVFILALGGWFAWSMRSRTSNSIPRPYSLDPARAKADVERNITNGEFRLPIVITSTGLRYAPFLEDPKSYSAVAGGHAVAESLAEAGVILRYSEAYWLAYLPELERQGKMDYYREKIKKAAEIKN